MATTIGNSNAANLISAIEEARSSEWPVSRVVRDQYGPGTILTFFDGRWIATPLDWAAAPIKKAARLAVVAHTHPEDSADNGLNQSALAMDMEIEGGEWIVDADDLDDLRGGYGEALEVIWEQDAD